MTDKAVPPAVPPLAMVGFRCPACGWSLLLPVSHLDMAANRGVSLWITCQGCGSYAFNLAVQPPGDVEQQPEGCTTDDAGWLDTLGITWEEA